MTLAKAVPAAVVALACTVLAVQAELARARTEPPPAASLQRVDALALEVGQRIAGWKVIALEGSLDTELRIDLARDDLRFAVVVTPMGARPENPPVQTDTHAIYYGHAQPSGTRVPEGAVRAITSDIARRLDAVR